MPFGTIKAVLYRRSKVFMPGMIGQTVTDMQMMRTRASVRQTVEIRKQTSFAESHDTNIVLIHMQVVGEANYFNYTHAVPTGNATIPNTYAGGGIMA